MRARVGAMVLGLLVAAATPVDARRYSLAELVSKVATDYPGVVAGREQVESARAQLLQAQRMWMPTGDFNFSLSGTPEVRCLPDSADPMYPHAGEPGGPTADSIPQSYRESHCIRTNVVDLAHGVNYGATSLDAVAPIHGVILSLNLNIVQPLFSFGRIEGQIANAKTIVAAAEEQLRKEQAEVAFNATRGYWAVKGARAAVDILVEAHQKLKERIDEVNAQLNGSNQGKYTEGDVARLKIAAANLDIILLDQRRNLAFAQHALCILTDDSTADVDDKELELLDAPLGQLDEWRARAMRLRPELRQARDYADGAKAWRKFRLADMLPELSATTNVGYGYASNMDTPQNWYMVRPSFINAVFGLTLHQPLDLGPRLARYSQARHDELSKQAQVRVSEIGYSAEVAQTFANYEEARGRVDETDRGERVSRGWNTAISEEVSPDGRELSEAVRNYFEFRLRHLQALVDANIALAALERAAGTDWRALKH